MIGKLGRRPAVHTAHSLRSSAIMRSALDDLGPAPPASTNWAAAVNAAVGGPTNWGMMANGPDPTAPPAIASTGIGCCVEAKDGHFQMLRTANTSGIVIPTSAQIIDLYSAETGYVLGNGATDNGTLMASDEGYMGATGLLGHKADMVASITPPPLYGANLDHVRWCVQLFGGLGLGFNLPASAQDQFTAGEPWDVIALSPIVGGHAVLITHYDPDYFYVSTWGVGEQKMTPAFLNKYWEEMWTEIYADWITAQGISPGGLDLAQLESDLTEVGAVAMKVGQSTRMKIIGVDQFLNPMPITPDSPPTWSPDLLGFGTVATNPDGSATFTATKDGSSYVPVTAVVGGQNFSTYGVVPIVG